MFNAKRTPSPEFLRDLEAEARRNSNDPAAKIARLTQEVRQLRQLADEPGTATETVRLTGLQ